MSLATLFTANGFTGPQVAIALAPALGPVDPLLFERVDQGRQPLPIIVANAIAIVLGVEPVDVVAESSSIIEDVRGISRLPRPPRLGDDFTATRLGLPPDAFEDFVFTPLAILGQQLFGWYRSDLDILTTPPDVTDWGDQGPASNDLDESTRRAVYDNTGGGVNGLPFLRFTDAGFDELDFPGAGIAGTSGSSWTFIFAVNPRVINGAFAQTFIDINSGIATDFAVAHEIDVGTNLGYFNNAVWTSIAPATIGMQILAFVFDEDEAECRVYRNKVLLGTGAYVPFDITPGGLLQTIGGSAPAIGGQRTPDMFLYEVVCYGQPIDTSTSGEWDRLHSDYLFPRYSLP